MGTYWTYSTEWSSVENIALLFKTLDEAKEHSLKSYLNYGLSEEDWEQLTSYYEFKIYKK